MSEDFGKEISSLNTNESFTYESHWVGLTFISTPKDHGNHLDVTAQCAASPPKDADVNILHVFYILKSKAGAPDLNNSSPPVHPHQISIKCALIQHTRLF